MSQSIDRTRPSTAQQASWAAYRQRRAVLEKIIASPRVGIEQWWNSREVQECFVDVDDVLRALHGRWSTMVIGSLDAELDGWTNGGDGTPEAAVRTAYKRAVDHAPKLRQVLDECAGYDVVRRLTRREHLALARLSGVWPSGGSPDDAVRVVSELVSPPRRVVRDRAPRRWGLRRNVAARVSPAAPVAPVG